MATTRRVMVVQGVGIQIFVILLGMLLSGCARAGPGSENGVSDKERVETWGFEVVRSIPHDPKAFTQGLVFYDGFLFESTGLNEASSVRKIDPADGKVLMELSLAGDYFGEGLTEWNGELFQLTWTSGKGFVYHPKNLRTIREFQFRGEGWGLAHDERHLILTDGSHKLQFLNPGSMKLEKIVEVKDQGTPVKNLNELEMIKGELFANIWHSQKVVRISPVDGRILGWVDLSGLGVEDLKQNPENVLNGIAFDSKGDRIFVTGKRWSKIYEVKWVPLKKK